nr:MAG TPA: hypothetical protein [Caudoviricetes sp.]
MPFPAPYYYYLLALGQLALYLRESILSLF